MNAFMRYFISFCFSSQQHPDWLWRRQSDRLAAVVSQGHEGRGTDSTLVLTPLQMTRVVMSSLGRGIHLQEEVCPKGPPPQPNLDLQLPLAPTGVQATPFQLQGPVQTQVRHGQSRGLQSMCCGVQRWAPDSRGVTQVLFQKDPTEG